jgi:ketosteroid isomerase-like protein
MPKAKTRANTLSGTAEEIETAFYEAMQLGDIDRLMACWADEDDVVCVHPGGARLVGNAAIRSAFEGMFANGSLRVHSERLRKIESISCSVHTLVERVEVLGAEGPMQAFLLATNVYFKTPEGWRMVAHHVSQGSEQSMDDADKTPQVLH